MGEKGPTRQPVIYGVTGALTGLTILVVILRVASRRFAKSTYWWDDWLLWFGAGLAVVINAETIYGAHLGLGRHGDEVPAENVVEYFKVGAVSCISLLVRYPNTSKPFVVFIYGVSFYATSLIQHYVPLVGLLFLVDYWTLLPVWQKKPSSIFTPDPTILLSIMTIYQWSMSAIKASLLLFYYRLFSVNKWLRWTVYFGLSFIMCWHVTYFFTLLFQCTPVAYFWDRTIPGGHCLDHGKVNNNAVSVSNAAFNIFTDIICIVTPLPVLWNLRLSGFKKACLTLIFLLGGCDIVISCIRLAYLVDGQTADVTWSNSLPALWTVLELNIAAVCASLPGLMPIVSHLLFSKRHSHVGPSGGNDIYRGTSKTSISTRAFHDGINRMSTDKAAILRREKLRVSKSLGEDQGDVESGCLQMRTHSRGSDSDGSMDFSQRPPRSIGGILVTSNLEQRVEREWT